MVLCITTALFSYDKEEKVLIKRPALLLNPLEVLDGQFL